jgi:DNA-directed RNA polymerase subunit M/transcription elongation factor TFIIS
MKFCKKCERILILTKSRSGKDVFFCPGCERVFKAEGNLKMSTKEMVKEKNNLGQGVAEKKTGKKSMDFVCKKCKNNSYEIIDLGIMYGDEDWVYLMQCSKCGTSERVGEGD